jgi:hypothetical protein
MPSHCYPFRNLTLSLVVVVAVFSSVCAAQEVSFLDLTKTAARVDLRRPKAASLTPAVHSGAQDLYHCPDPTNNVGTLRISLVSLDRTLYQAGDEPKFEVTVENAGATPVRIPISPHLADLQHKDAAQEFAYYELQIVLWIDADNWSTNTAGGATLYGANDNANTMLTLNPGEWIRVIARGRLVLDSSLADLIRSGHRADHLHAEASVYREKTLITPTQSATSGRELCLAQIQGQTLPIELITP